MLTESRILKIKNDISVKFLKSEHGSGFTSTIRADLAGKDFISWYGHLQGKIDFGYTLKINHDLDDTRKVLDRLIAQGCKFIN